MHGCSNETLLVLVPGIENCKNVMCVSRTGPVLVGKGKVKITILLGFRPLCFVFSEIFIGNLSCKNKIFNCLRKRTMSIRFTKSTILGVFRSGDPPELILLWVA